MPPADPAAPRRATAELFERVRQVGRLEWIGLSGAHRAPIASVEAAELRVGTGIEGDHHARKGGGARQVTLVQAEHLDVIGRLLGREAVAPELLRRNLVVSGINLRSLERRRFRIGEAVLQESGECDPCSRMEESLGPGGYQAMRGHGGITAIVLEGGRIRLGDPVEALGL